jgi:hypothetical protein
MCLKNYSINWAQVIFKISLGRVLRYTYIHSIAELYDQICYLQNNVVCSLQDLLLYPQRAIQFIPHIKRYLIQVFPSPLKIVVLVLSCRRKMTLYAV